MNNRAAQINLSSSIIFYYHLSIIYTCKKVRVLLITYLKLKWIANPYHNIV